MVDQQPYELRLVLQESWKELRSSSFWLSSLGGPVLVMVLLVILTVGTGNS